MLLPAFYPLVKPGFRSSERSADYLRYLEKKQVGWLIQEKERFDVPDAPETLNRQFDIRSIRDPFHALHLTNGLPDEINVLVCPLLVGGGMLLR